MTFLYLFFEFFKVGLFAVGGGLATIPFLMDIANRYDWFTQSELTDMIAISESTPGAMGVNMSTYVGFSVKGVLGAVIATLGLVLPSIIVILIISRMLEKFKDSKLVQKIFYGLRPASTGLIIAAGVGVATETFFGSSTVAGIERGILAVALYFAIRKWKKHPVVYIAAAAVVGIIFQL